MSLSIRRRRRDDMSNARTAARRPELDAGALLPADLRVALAGVPLLESLEGRKLMAATASSYVFVDANANGVRESSEAGLGGVTVYADANANNRLDSGERSAVTAANGTYRIDNLPVGVSVQVRIVTPSGYAQTKPANNGGYWFRSFDGMYNTSTVFGVRPTTTTTPTAPTTPTTPSSTTSASIASHVFVDSDGDGVRDAGEAGLGGATVYVDLDADNARDAAEPSTTTAADGTYRIDNLPLNRSVQVRVVLPSGYAQTKPTSNGGYWFKTYAGMRNTTTVFGGKPTSTTTPTTPTTPTSPTTPTTGASVPVVANASAPIARITAVSATGLTVGQSVHLDALASTLNYGQPTTARYEWDFGDPTAAYNKLVGFNASHSYDKAGTYTVTLRVINEAGKASTTTTTVNVAADARPAIYVSAAGNDANNGATQSTAVKTFARAASLLSRRSGVQILFRRGDTFDTSTEMVIVSEDVSVGAYGSGNSPVIRYNGPRNSTPHFLISTNGAKDTTIRGLTFDSIYGSDTDQTYMPTAVMLRSNGVTIRDNVFRNVGYAINVGDTSTGVLVQSNAAPLATGIRGYFVYAAAATHLTITGNVVANSTREHNVRTVGSSRVLIYDNDLTNLDRRDVDIDDFAKNTINIQRGAYAYVAGNELDGPGSFGPLGTAANIAEKATRTSHAVFEGNHQKTGIFTVLHGAEHVMIRNNVFDQDNDYQVSVQGYDSSFGRGAVDVSILNNTGLNEGTQGGFLRTYSPVDGIVVLNNLYVAPSLVTGAYAASPVQIWDTDMSNFTRVNSNIWSDPTKLGWAQGGINWLGMGVESSSYQTATEWNALANVGTDQFVDVTTTSTYAPVGAASVTEAGTAVGGVFVDYYGKYRELNEWTIGAVEI